MIGCEEHPIKTEESANQSEGCDAKLEGPERAASCTLPLQLRVKPMITNHFP